MFDANKGNQMIADQVDERTDEFAALFQELPPRQRLSVIDKMNELLENPDQVQAFAAGTFAQNSQGQPAAQLGSSSSTPTGGNQPPTEDEALNILMSSPALSSNVKNALRRILNPRDPQLIAVESDGTPSDIASLQRALNEERDERQTGSLAAKLKKALDDLADERDASRPGSLAKQLADARAATRTPADMVSKADVKTKIDEIQVKAGQLDTRMMSSHIDGLDELESAVEEAAQLVR